MENCGIDLHLSVPCITISPFRSRNTLRTPQMAIVGGGARTITADPKSESANARRFGLADISAIVAPQRLIPPPEINPPSRNAAFFASTEAGP